MFTSVAADMGMIGIFRRFRHNRILALSLVTGLMLLAPCLSLAEVSILKGAAARSLIQSNTSQPLSLSRAQWGMALAELRYVGETFLISGDPNAVFSGPQIQMLAPEFEQYFAAIRAGQALIFKTGKIRGEVFFSHGSLYWYFSHINNSPAFDLTVLAKENAMTSDAIESVSEDDIDISYWHLSPRQGQSLYRDRPDMLAMPVSKLSAAIKAPQSVRQADDLPAHAQASHAPLIHIKADEKRTDMVSRIKTLHGFLNKALITQQAYDEKLLAMIDDYEKRYPALEDGLTLLRRLDKQGLIAPDLLRKQQKRLLDRL